MAALKVMYLAKDEGKVLDWDVFGMYDYEVESEWDYSPGSLMQYGPGTLMKEINLGDKVGLGAEKLINLHNRDVEFIAFGTGYECGARATISFDGEMLETPIDDFNRFVIGIDGFTDDGLIYDETDKSFALEFMKLRDALIDKWDIGHIIQPMKKRRTPAEDEMKPSLSYVEAVTKTEKIIADALTELSNLTDCGSIGITARTLTDNKQGQKNKRKVDVFIDLR